jgi:hypothetical protein
MCISKNRTSALNFPLHCKKMQRKLANIPSSFGEHSKIRTPVFSHFPISRAM